MNTEEVIYMDNILLAWSEKGHHRHGNTGNSTCRVTGRSFLGVSSWILTSHQLHRITSGWYVIKKEKKKRRCGERKTSKHNSRSSNFQIKKQTETCTWSPTCQYGSGHGKTLIHFTTAVMDFKSTKFMTQNDQRFSYKRKHEAITVVRVQVTVVFQHEDQCLWSKYHESDSALHKHPSTKAATGPCFCNYFCPYMYIMVTIT